MATQELPNESDVVINVKNKPGNEHVYPAKHAFFLDNPLRRWLMRQRAFAKQFVREGMTVLDVGCGSAPLLFDLARAVGPTGHIICADLQQGMLDRVAAKARRKRISSRVRLHRCESTKVGLEPDCVDLAIAFWMVHETPSPEAFVHEMATTVRPGGVLLIVEPKHHVKPQLLEAYENYARDCGLRMEQRPRVRFSWSLMFRRPAERANCS